MATRRDKRKYGLYAKDTRKVGYGAPIIPSVPTIKEINAWIRVNGTDIDSSNARQATIDLTEREVMSFSHIVDLSAGDYLELMFAVNDLNLAIQAIGVTGFNPATPSVTLSVTEI